MRKELIGDEERCTMRIRVESSGKKEGTKEGREDKDDGR